MPSPLDHIRAHPDLFRHQGAVLAGWRTYRGHRLGPYYRLAWRENGRQRSIYLGPEGSLVAEVRQSLATLQKPHREDVTIRKLWREGWRQFRATRLQLAVQLAMHGLQLKGSEIRGWRSLYPPSSRPPLPGLGFPRCCSYRVHVPRIIPDTVVHALESGYPCPLSALFAPENQQPITDNPAVLHSSLHFGLHHSLFDIHHSPPAARSTNNEQGSPNVEVKSGSRPPPHASPCPQRPPRPCAGRQPKTDNRQPPPPGGEPLIKSATVKTADQNLPSNLESSFAFRLRPLPRPATCDLLPAASWLRPSPFFRHSGFGLRHFCMGTWGRAIIPLDPQTRSQQPTTDHRQPFIAAASLSATAPVLLDQCLTHRCSAVPSF